MHCRLNTEPRFSFVGAGRGEQSRARVGSPRVAQTLSAPRAMTSPSHHRSPKRKTGHYAPPLPQEPWALHPLFAVGNKTALTKNYSPSLGLYPINSAHSSTASLAPSLTHSAPLPCPALLRRARIRAAIAALYRARGQPCLCLLRPCLPPR